MATASSVTAAVDLQTTTTVPSGNGTYVLAEKTIDVPLQKLRANYVTFEAIDGRAAVAFDEKNELRTYVQLSGKMTHGVCLREGECVDYSQPVAIALEDELEVSRTRMVVRVVAQGSVREKPVRATVGLRVRVEQRRKRDSYEHVTNPSREGMLPRGTTVEMRMGR